MSIKNIFITAILSTIMLFAIGQSTIFASSSDNLFGNAWSGNIGWISFNNCSSAASCPGINYGVTMDATGNLSGYAWNDNIGWISFNVSNGDLSGCPATFQQPYCQPKIDPTTGAFRGFARVVSALSSNSSGWDGWINISGVTASTANTQGVRTISGYAWGSDVVGWIDMSGVSVGNAVQSTTPSVTLTANTTSVQGNGGQSTLTWTSANVDSCVASALKYGTQAETRSDWTGTKATSNATGVVVTLPNYGVTYIITCTNNTTSVSVSSSVTVNIIGLNLVIGTPSPLTISEPAAAALPGSLDATYFTISGDFDPSATNTHVYMNFVHIPPTGGSDSFTNDVTQPSYLFYKQNSDYTFTQITPVQLASGRSAYPVYSFESGRTFKLIPHFAAPIVKNTTGTGTSPRCGASNTSDCAVGIGGVIGDPAVAYGTSTFYVSPNFTPVVPTCLAPKVYNPASNSCADPVTCTAPKVRDPATNTCVDSSTGGKPKPKYKEL